ncbi:MAG: hypothetical protein K6E63_04655 [Lachnospiraceae bacterium]|nr:hypothetical protein [Lachnospiraceae bacterium]
MTSQKKIASGIISIMVLVVVLFSSVYIAKESDHVCHDEDCPVCACLHQCEDMLHQLSSGFTGLIMVAVAFAVFAVPVLIPAFDLLYETPVSRKVRLND